LTEIYFSSNAQAKPAWAFLFCLGVSANCGSGRQQSEFLSQLAQLLCQNFMRGPFRAQMAVKNTLIFQWVSIFRAVGISQA
jgi:hypothetical protein